jgi:hypothetical protein
MRGPKLNQKMNMIRRATNAFALPTKSVNGASQILMQTRTPRCGNQWFAVFRGENQMIVQAQERGGHL